MYDIGEPMIIDVAGTIKELLKWALKEALLLLGILMFGLSAPLLFTVGAEWLAWRYPQYASTWAVVYLFTGPFACCIWMLFIAFFGFDRNKLSWIRRQVRYTGFMVAGFFGSILAETVLIVVLMRLFPDDGNSHLMLVFAVAPFAVFAPVLLVLLSRWIRRDEYATAQRRFGK